MLKENDDHLTKKSMFEKIPIKLCLEIFNFDIGENMTIFCLSPSVCMPKAINIL